MKIHSFVLTLFFLVASVSTAQIRPDNESGRTATAGSEMFIGVPAELQNSTEKFFSMLLESGPEKAFKTFLEKSPISEKKDQINVLIAQTRRSYELYGKMYGYEPVNSEIVSNSFIRLRYLGLHEKFPMRWIFTFYKSPVMGWIVINIKFDDYSEYLFSDE